MAKCTDSGEFSSVTFAKTFHRHPPPPPRRPGLASDDGQHNRYSDDLISRHVFFFPSPSPAVVDSEIMDSYVLFLEARRGGGGFLLFFCLPFFAVRVEVGDIQALKHTVWIGLYSALLVETPIKILLVVGERIRLGGRRAFSPRFFSPRIFFFLLIFV